MAAWEIEAFVQVEMVNIPIYNPAEGVHFPRFGIKLPEGESAEDFVSSMKEGAWEIIGDIFDREFLVRWAIGGMMPRLDWVF